MDRGDFDAVDGGYSAARRRALRRGAVIRVGGRAAVFVKCWGTIGAVVRFDDHPQEPKVVPVGRIEPA